MGARMILRRPRNKARPWQTYEAISNGCALGDALLMQLGLALLEGPSPTPAYPTGQEASA